MPTCEHRKFSSQVIVTRVTKTKEDPTVIAYRAEITVKCQECDEPFLFMGSGGATGLELLVPIRPASSLTTGPGVN